MNKYSNYKIAWFPDKLESFKTKEVEPPIYVRIKPTNRCNHDCPTCIYMPNYYSASSMVRAEEMPWSKLSEVLDDLVEMKVKAITWSGGGEPLFHPNIVEAIQKARDGGIDQSIISNGQLLKGEKAEELADFSWVRISFEYWDHDSFETFRGVSGRGFDIVLNNLREFAKQKSKDCTLGAGYIVSRENYKEIYGMTKILKDVGFQNIRFSALEKIGMGDISQDKSAYGEKGPSTKARKAVEELRAREKELNLGLSAKDNFKEYHRKVEQEVLEELNRCRELDDDNFKVYDSYNIDFQSQASTSKKCYIQQIIPVVAGDSHVYNCHNKAYDKTGMIGSIENQRFKDLWYSEKTKEKFDTFSPLKSCQNQVCSANLRNIIISEIMDADGINFI